MKRLVVTIVLLIIILFGLVPQMASPVTSSSDADHVRVIIQYKPGSRSALEQAIKANGGEFHYKFDSLNSFAVTLPVSALDGIARNPNVVLIEDDAPRYITGSTTSPVFNILAQSPYEEQVIPYGIDMVQARDVWDPNHDGLVDPGAPTGAGKTVCIIDTGLYIEHEDLLGVDVIGGYGYRVNLPWDEDGVGHGTHVAGTITAMNNNLGVVGVTPGTVSLYIVRVFNDQGNWINASTLIDASNRCANAGADIISMSLSGAIYSATEEAAFDTHFANGILSIGAASNDGVSTYHYPASYDSVISVGALDATKTWADFSNFNDQVELAAPGVSVLSTVPFIETNTVMVDSITYYGNHIENTARGTASGFLVDGGLCGLTNTSWNGMVVLCERGDNTFAEKVLNVQNSGGTAALIYNNVPDNFYGTIDPNNSSIIGLSLSQADGQFLRTYKLDMNASVTSNLPVTGSGYEAWDGTSMATPHVSGVAALVWSCLPEATNAQVRNALTSTALDLGAAGRDDYYGYGLVQALDACEVLRPTSIEIFLPLIVK
jgi:subtilisin family serine protease